MITSINSVDSKTDQPQVQASTAVVYPEEEINPEDIPFQISSDISFSH